MILPQKSYPFSIWQEINQLESMAVSMINIFFLLNHLYDIHVQYDILLATIRTHQGPIIHEELICIFLSLFCWIKVHCINLIQIQNLKIKPNDMYLSFIHAEYFCKFKILQQLISSFINVGSRCHKSSRTRGSLSIKRSIEEELCAG